MELAKLDVFVSIETLRSYINRLDFESYRAARKAKFTTRHRKISTVKYGGGDAMVWGCFWGGGFEPLEMIDTGFVDQKTYINTLTNRFHP
ncbi:hypothetical protein RO3G_10000 [Rhizopus delemar RA 99-880]|uniref:Uncharacterized protein n=1 Tax=Rhizopus delemar (strain RA 99-880 / ATCC MYA-4621 / FGSC 9543 / NRRL 43880) TaxID=246409 RepID=I1CA10_RHIO9|nr:hypothetical protein RO3G_10000 [Rhizopus delemar RA 99-880]|eukprot:EIE85290.1 hypothetical protein RO3G_10000 [Rhizopus delemar RA 99-880]